MRIRLTAVLMVLVLIAPLSMPVHGGEFDSPGVRDAIDTPGAYVDKDQNTREDVPEKPSAATSPSVADVLGVVVNTGGESAMSIVKKGFGAADKVATGADVITNIMLGNYEDAAAKLANGILGGLLTAGGAAFGTVIGGPGAGTYAGAAGAATLHSTVIAPAIDDLVHYVLPIDENNAAEDKEKQLKHLNALGDKLMKDYKVPLWEAEQAMAEYRKGKADALTSLRNEYIKKNKDLRNSESTTEVDLDSLDEPLTGMPGSQTFFNNKDKDADGKVLQGLNLMDAQNALENAGTASDDAKAQAGNMRNEAGEDAMDITKQAANESADDKNKNSWGNIITGKIADGIEKGGTTAAETIGDAAADGAVKEVFPKKQTSSKPSTPPPPPAPKKSEPPCPGY